MKIKRERERERERKKREKEQREKASSQGEEKAEREEGRKGMSSTSLLRNETNAAGTRTRRGDLGSVRFSQRDGELLAIVGEQFAVTVEQLAVLMGRSFRAGRWLRDRWLQAGWVESKQLLADGPSLLWLTAFGVRVARSPYRRWRPNPGMAAHIEAVTDVRLLLERQLLLGSWEPERELAKTAWSASLPRPHLPDGVLATRQGRVAVEVELTLKSRVRLEQIIAILGERYPQVWYFAAPPALAALEEIASAARWQNVHVYSYPPAAGEPQATR